MKRGGSGPDDAARGVAAALEVSKGHILDGKVSLDGA
jgi:hypothetical protein